MGGGGDAVAAGERARSVSHVTPGFFPVPLLFPTSVEGPLCQTLDALQLHACVTVALAGWQLRNEPGIGRPLAWNKSGRYKLPSFLSRQVHLIAGIKKP